MPNWLVSMSTFLAGVLVTAIVAEFARRYFDRARLELRIADLALTRTRDRFQVDLETKPELRRLLADWQVEDLSWSKTFYCEDDLDVAILDTFRNECEAARASAEFDRLIQLLHNANLAKLVFEFACNAPLFAAAKNGLIMSRDRTPQIPATLPAKPVFPIQTQIVDEKGRECRYLYLDLQGAATPLVGDGAGDPYVNDLLAPLVYAVSFVDKDVLAQIFNLAKEYSELARQQYRAIRENLVSAKAEVSYLAVEVVAANVGQEPALLSQQATILLGDTPGSIVLSHVDKMASEKDERPRAVILRSVASGIRQRYGVSSAVLDGYDSPLSYLVIQPGESQRLRFVSLSAISMQQRDAVNAARTGHLIAKLELRQTTARNLSNVLGAASYDRSIRCAQRITRVAP